MTAYRWFREGELPVPARRAGRLILVDQPPVSAVPGITAVYAHVSSADQRSDLDRQVAGQVVVGSEQIGGRRPPHHLGREEARLGRCRFQPVQERLQRLPGPPCSRWPLIVAVPSSRERAASTWRIGVPGEVTTSGVQRGFAAAVGYHTATPNTIQRRFLESAGTITTGDQVTASIDRRAYSPSCAKPAFPDSAVTWWHATANAKAPTRGVHLRSSRLPPGEAQRTGKIERNRHMAIGDDHRHHRERLKKCG